MIYLVITFFVIALIYLEGIWKGFVNSLLIIFLAMIYWVFEFTIGEIGKVVFLGFLLIICMVDLLGGGNIRKFKNKILDSKYGERFEKKIINLFKVN